MACGYLLPMSKPRPETNRRRRLAVLPGLVAFALLAWQLDFLTDDAYISFRYARNFAEGHGLRYNLTLGGPVEGYSNFLWVVWLGLLDRVGLEPPLWSRVSSVACGFLLVAWVTRHAAKKLELDGPGEVATGLVFATLPPVAVWATGGLATMATALFVFGAYERLLGNPERPRGFQAGVFAALAGLIRADGALWIAFLGAAALLVWWLRGRERRLFGATVKMGTILLLAVGAHVAWRLSYYGDWLPNTARVKAGFSSHRLERGVDYLAATLLSAPALLAAGGAALAALGGRAREMVIVALVVLLPTGAYAVYVGGDFMPMGRFLFPAAGFVGLLFAAAWSRLQRGPALGLAAVLVAVNVAGCFDWNVVPASLRSRFHFRQDREWESELSMQRGMNERAAHWALQGRALARVVEPGETMSLGAIGAMGYHSRLEIYDSYGLVTPSVIEAVEPLERSSPGHDRRVGPMFFNDRQPTYAGSILVRRDKSFEDQLGGFDEHPLSKLVRLEHHPLGEVDGFQPGDELVVLRFVRWE